jgi:uncharacterized protein (DUF4213/DUF364 family)
MLKKNEVSERLVELLKKEAEDAVIEDVRIGLGFTAVKLSDGRTGLAAVLRHEIETGCTTFSEAGTLRGRPAIELLLTLVYTESVVSRSLGLAAANALIFGNVPDLNREDTLEQISLTEKDRVVMVGFFRPLVPRIKEITPHLTVIEKDLSRCEGVSIKEAQEALQNSSVALITATSIMNSSLEEILNSLGSPRRVVLLGPSTPLIKEAFTDTPVNHLAGSRVKDAEKVLQVVSEGGGTPLMKPFIEFVNVLF